MKKTFTANISGRVFHIEDDAYDRMQHYLSGIRSQFEGASGREEIMADIEARIAELFHERLAGTREAVSLSDVEHVIAVMGQPEDYGDAEPGGTAPPHAAKGHEQRGYKRFFRDADDKWVGGVIGGLAAYIGMDPIWLRIIMIVFILAGWGVPILLYVLLWILVPKAESAADRLRMEGEPVTVDNLKRAFEEGGQRVAGEARDLGRKWSRDAQSRSGMAADVIGKLIGAFIILVGFGLLVGLITSLVGGGFGLWHITLGHDDLGLFDLGALVFPSSQHALWFCIGALLLCLIPIIGILLGGFRLLLNTRTPAWLGWGLSLLWFAALVPTIIGGLSLAREFHRGNAVRDELPLQQPAEGMIYLDALLPRDSEGDWSFSFDDGGIDIDLSGLMLDGDSISGSWARINVERSDDTLFHLVRVRESRGMSAKAAHARAMGIATGYRQEGDALFISPLARYAKSDKIRAQHARFTLRVPQGKAVFLRPSSRSVIHDIRNVENVWDGDMIGKAWRMTPRGLEEDGPSGPNETEEQEGNDTSGAMGTVNRSAVEASTGSLKLPSILGLLRLRI